MSESDQGLLRLEALVSPIGQELLNRLRRMDVTPETELRVGALLRRDTQRSW